MIQSKIYAGIDLLEKIFEFTEMTPNPEQWRESVLYSNPPRLIRLRQIESLISAFFEKETNRNILSKARLFLSSNQKLTIQSILTGDFIKARTLEEYTDLVSFIKNIVKERELYVANFREVHIGQLALLYQQLIKYKRQIINLLNFNSDWLESSSITSRFSIYLTNSISENLLYKYTDLDKALELLINPRQLSFTEEELKEKYRFPQDNLMEIDINFA